jgi:N6-adenosine-specific RNA methylase IME4
LKYDIIYADPPWDSNRQFTRDANRGNIPHYPLLRTKDIIVLPVSELAAENSVLFLWAVDSQLPEALYVIKEWGFTYVTVGFTWVKTIKYGKDHVGTGMWTRKNPEMCLFAKRGNPKRLSASVRQLQRHQVREHSRKPDAIRDEIVRLCGDVPRIELFARSSAPGWDVWGNEVEKFQVPLPSM